MGEVLPVEEFLRRVDCFAALDENSLRLLGEKMRRVEYASGEFLCEEGETGDWMFIIASGAVAVLKSAGGTLIQVAALKPGDFGGMMSVFERNPRSATLQARGPVQLWMLDHDTFQQLIQRNPALSMKMLAMLSNRTRRDSHTLAETLRYVEAEGLQEIYQECSPEERLILDTINRKVASAESLDAVMNFVFESIQPISKCDRMSVAFIEEDGNRLVSYWTRADYEPVLLTNGYAADLQGTSLAPVLESGQPRVINDLVAYLDEHPRSVSTKLIAKEGMRSSMTCPLVVEGRPVGFLFRSSRQPSAYDDHQVRLHLAMAERLSQAVEKAWQIQQLTKANSAYFEMLGFVSHELKSPLASTVMDAKVLTGGYLGPLMPKQQDSLERIIAKCNYLLGLIGEYLDLARVEGGELEPGFRQDVPFIDDIVENAIDIVRPQVEAKNMVLMRNWDALAQQAECAPDLMRIVLVNLLSNAVKYGNEGGEIRVDAAMKDGALHFSVWNEGPGFPIEEQGKLFRKFSRLQTPELLQRKGTGVGLYTTWRIVQAHHGKIRARSKHGQWAEFTVDIPQPVEAPTPTPQEAGG